MSYTLSQDQVLALRQIGSWYRSRSAPYLTLGGYAGTGKTTLVAYLRKALRDFDDEATVAFCAYTGKATRVLRDKLHEQRVAGRSDAISTIHSLIYTTEESLDGTPPVLHSRHPELDSGSRRPYSNTPTGTLQWARRDKLDYSLIVVDEASMVDEAIWHDLLSFGIPILAVGDHGQLPPVGSHFNLMAGPMMRLEHIFRQAEDSPIIEVATLARETGLLPIREFGPGVRKLDRSLPETGLIVQELLESWRPDLMILCGYNTTRVKLNRAIRELREMEGPEPQSGDRVVCLRNNRAKHIYNGILGQIVRVVPVTGKDGTDWYEMEIALEGEDYTYFGYALREQFGAAASLQDVPLAPDGQRGDLWDFGYALTVHKAQGSQAERVLVFEERFARASEEDWRRWLYTAVTRAEVGLTVVGD